jgi:hypothetical protein
MIMALLTACGWNSTQKQLPSPTSNSAQGSTPIIITVGDKVITATLDNSELSQEFIKLLPQTISMSRLKDREYYGRIQEAFQQTGSCKPRFKMGM